MTTSAPTLVLPLSERDHVRGGGGIGSVDLVEYGDYECPVCAAAYPLVKEALERLGDRLLFAFRNFPLTEIHPHAEPAARMAEAAAFQGKFWRTHDALFENHGLVTRGNLAAIAGLAGLDERRLAIDVMRPEISQRLREDFLSGVRSGVNGTPTFFIDGVRYDGPRENGGLLRALIVRSRAA
jgi:protein-disulfide isomerase